MRASVGDRIIIKGHRIHEPDRDGEVIEVRGTDGAPPDVVRWGDNGHEVATSSGASSHAACRSTAASTAS